jgi:hypothetical protein
VIEVLDAPPLQILDRPFGTERRELAKPLGLTIADLLRYAHIPPGTPVRVYLNGDVVYPEYYHVIRPKPGAHVLVRVIPRGGGRGGQGKNIGQMIVGILLIVVGTLSTIDPWEMGLGATYGIPLITMGVGLLLGGLINMLIPPPHAPGKLKSLAGVTSNQEPESPTLSISGQANTARPYAVVPRIYGRHRIFPPYAAAPYTEMVGADQYLRLLFCVGQGPTEIDELKIGDTAIGNFQAVETEIRTGVATEPPLTLYTTDINEAPLTIVLLSGVSQIRTSSTNAVELSIDLAFPEGLVQFGGETGAEKLTTSVSVTVEYRLVGATPWATAPGSPLVTTDARQSFTRNGLRWTVPSGQYDVRLTRVTADSADPLLKNLCVWSALRSYGADAPVTLPGLALVAMRIKATDQLNGVVDSFNCIAHSLHQDFSTHPAVVLGYEPIGYWRLGEVTGALVAFDASGHDHPGVYHGTPLLGSPGLLVGDPDTAIVCDGIDDAVDTFTGLATTNMGGGSFTIECLIQPATASGTRGILRKSNGAEFATGAAGWALQLDGTMLQFCRGTGSGLPAVLSSEITAGARYHVLVVYSITTGIARLWLNGMPVAAATVGTTPYADTFNLEFCQDRTGFMRARALAAPRAVTAVSYFHARYFHARYFAAGYFTFTLTEGIGFALAPYFFAVPDVPVPTGGAGASVPPFWFAVANPSTVGGRYAGTLDDVALYPVALTDDQIAALYSTTNAAGDWVLRRTSNPASHYREVLQGPGNARPIPDARLDLAELEAWHRENSAGGRSHNRVIDFPTTVYQLLREIAACGRATPTMNDLKFSAVRDLAQTVPRQIFTPRNSRNFHGRRVIPDELHALKVGFIDPQSNWQQVERIAYKDGYGPVAGPGLLAASRFESFDLPGCTDPDLAWRIGRYHLATAQLRPEAYEFETDVENLACRRGDLIQIAHDVTEWGVAWGRVKSVATNLSGLGVSVTLDEAVPMSTGQIYAMRFRFADLRSVVVAVQTPPGPGVTPTVTFPSPMTPPLPEPGDLALLGIVGKESIPAIVSMIRPGQDLSAVLTVVDAAPEVLVADQKPIPAWDPQITLPIATEQMPPTPIIEAVVSDESVLIRALDGSLRSAIVVTLHYQSTSNVQADYLDTRIRRSGTTGPYDVMPQLPAGTTRVQYGLVEDGAAYDLRLRTVNRAGAASPWAEVLNYTVIGKTTLPPAPINPRLTGSRLEWDYPTPPPDLDGFLVRGLPGALANWPVGLTLHVGVVSASPFILPPMFGQWTLMIAAVDTSGNESDPVASRTVTFDDVRIHNQVATFDYKAASWPGTITNGVTIGGNLAAAGVPTTFWGADTARFWPASGTALFWAGTYQQMVYAFSYAVTGTSVGARILLQTTMVAESWTLEYEASAGVWLPFPGALENVAAATYNFRIITFAAASQAVLSRLTLIVDADDLTTTYNNVAIAATTGTRLTLAATYRAITQVTATVLASGGETAISTIVADQQNTAGANNGPLIRCYDQAGAVVAGHVNATIRGY